MFGVDAQHLDKTKALKKCATQENIRFDHVAFYFPHVGTLTDPLLRVSFTLLLKLTASSQASARRMSSAISSSIRSSSCAFCAASSLA